MVEPRPLPDIPGINKMRWYCFDCVFQTVTEFEMKTHQITAHEQEVPLNGLDFGLGGMYLTMQRQRDEWIELQSLSFLLEMHEGFGADDFVAEAEIRSN